MLLKGLDFDLLQNIYTVPSITTLKIIFSFCLLEAVLLVVLPGQWWYGSVTPAGMRPGYKLNGLTAFVATHLLLYIGAYQLKLFSLATVHDKYGEILTFNSFFSFVMCIFFYFKGLYFPSSKDSGSTGSFIVDFFWGTELHPQLFGYNIKQYVNCRIAMMLWSPVIICFAAKQYELYGSVSNSMWASVVIQVVYIGKFFYWENGYFNSIDIMHDRFGFYIFWGITCWLPAIYTIVPMYLVYHPIQLSTGYLIFVIGLGVASVYINWEADEQRLRVRETNGNTKIWGKSPEIIVAEYTTGDGKTHKSLLLLSGWWGMARHFHYLPELLLSLAWTLPACFNSPVPYLYVTYLTGLLVHRLFRDETRCRAKYGKYYDQYIKRVPFYLIPQIF